MTRERGLVNGYDGDSKNLNEAIIMLEQAKAFSNDYTVFIANLNAFVSAARSVTLIMQKEFNSIAGFKKWYLDKQQWMAKNEEFKFFNTLRVDTVHIRPFNAPSRYMTKFTGGLTIPAGTTVIIPVGKTDDRGNIVVSDQQPVIVNDQPDPSIQRSTSRSYCFTERPTEDAIALCERYLHNVGGLVRESHQAFQIGV
jgi:hypothetical protein